MRYLWFMITEQVLCFKVTKRRRFNSNEIQCHCAISACASSDDDELDYVSSVIFPKHPARTRRVIQCLFVHRQFTFDEANSRPYIRPVASCFINWYYAHDIQSQSMICKVSPSLCAHLCVRCVFVSICANKYTPFCIWWVGGCVLRPCISFGDIAGRDEHAAKRTPSHTYRPRLYSSCTRVDAPLSAWQRFNWSWSTYWALQLK